LLPCRKKTRRREAFSSQAGSLGDSENATKQKSGHFQAKRDRLATRKMRPNKNQVIFKPSGIAWLSGKCDQTSA
jgi:hypothetical protein